MYQGLKWQVLRDTYETAEGKRHCHETVKHPGAVVILPLSPSGDIYFVRQYRHSIEAELLELPAGTRIPGEAPLACAQRELREELSLHSTAWIPFGTLYPAPGFCDERQFLFVANDCSHSPGVPDEDEIIEPVVLSKAETLEAIARGEIQDAKSLALLFKAQICGHCGFASQGR